MYHHHNIHRTSSDAPYLDEKKKNKNYLQIKNTYTPIELYEPKFGSSTNKKKIIISPPFVVDAF